MPDATTNEDLGLAVEAATDTGQEIPVHISYEIIRLFSEGLYQSPQKAIEELVSNSYDAGATHVRVLLPEPPSDEQADDADQAAAPELDLAGDGSMEGVAQPLAPLWVIDDGIGMDESGFARLWKVAHSSKAGVGEQKIGKTTRAPIGQFGIGKLAAYVLAHRLTHISCVNGSIKATTMSFRDLEDRHQFEENEPFKLKLYSLSEDEAKVVLADIEERDPDAWALLFGEAAAPTWTVAALDDFKELYSKLHAGRLNWVLSTGLPLHTEFQIWLDTERIKSSKVNYESILDYVVGGDDEVAKTLGLAATATGVVVPGIDGEVTGSAVIYKKRLTEGKSDQYSRSHGFFVRVRDRVINLEDELFGLDALNHSAWARFSMEIQVDGLRDHLLSSREGVRESDAITELRKYLHGVFNACRRAFDEWSDRDLQGYDVKKLLSDSPSLLITEPLIAGVQEVLASASESYYVVAPSIDAGQDKDDWLREFAAAAAETPIAKVQYEGSGPYDRALRFVPETRTLILNSDHPFVDKLMSVGRNGNRGAATLFGTSELLLDALLRETGISHGLRIELFDDRDRLLRVLAGDRPSTAAEVLRLLDVANHDENALERAVGAAFQVLGFDYERRGGNVGGTDGVLFAKLGQGLEGLADYTVVYDAKQTGKPAVPADKIDLDSIEDFRLSESADFSFFFAHKFEAQDEPEGKLNKKVRQGLAQEPPRRVTLLRIEDLRRIVELHYRYGITLTRLRTLFEKAHSVPEVRAWVDELEVEMTELEPRVPLRRLLMQLEASKDDTIARPNIRAVRAVDDELKKFTPAQLAATLAAVVELVGDRWMELDSTGDVVLHHTADQISTEVERRLGDLFGIDPMSIAPDEGESS